MNIGRLVRHLDFLDESRWLEVLHEHDFWRDSPVYQEQYDDAHKALAFFTLAGNGRLGLSAGHGEDSPDFDHASVPKAVLEDERLQVLVSGWAQAHSRQYGPGFVAKMGLYAFAPGGHAGYHVDGIVRLAGDPYDLSTQREWDAATHIQSSHRTVMPLLLGEGAEFLIVGRAVRMTPGLWFEFSNTLPHAFFNHSDRHSILLVTTYRPVSHASF